MAEDYEMESGADELFEALLKPDNSDEAYCEVLEQIKAFLQVKRDESEIQVVSSNVGRFTPIVTQFLAHRNLHLSELVRAVLESAYALIPSEFFSESMVSALKSLLDGSTAVRLSGAASRKPTVATPETVRIRVYELLFHIGTKSSDSLQQMDRTGLTGVFFDELSAAIGDSAQCDLLAALNYVQLLNEFVSTQHGVVYIDSPPHSTLDKLDTALRRTLSETERLSNPLLGYFWPALLKLFASMARHNCVWLFERRTCFWDSLKVAVTQTVEDSMRLIAIETLGWVLEPAANKVAVQRYWQADFAACLTQLRHQLLGRSASAEGETRVRIAECLSRLLHTQTQSDQSANQVVVNWLTLLGNVQFVAATLALIRRQAPSDPLRIALFQTLCTVANCPEDVGVQAMRDCAGLLEYLQDRSTENGSNSEAKRAKYDVVAALVARRQVASRVFEPTVMLQLLQFVSDGPFYAQAEARVDLEAPN